MFRITLLAVLAATCFAQNAEDLFNRPPAAVDQALRARITEFYGYHISGQPRKAEALVAEDTKDYFYNNNKPAYTHCEIKHIAYSDNFTRAKATMVCGMYVMVPGFTDKPLDVPIPSTWKIEDGKWMWYVDQQVRHGSPMGLEMKPGPQVYTAPNSPNAKGLPTLPTSPDFLYSLVKVEKSNVEMKRGETAEVSIANTSPGTMNLSIAGKLAGVDATIDNPSPKGNQKAVLKLKAGENAESGTLEIVVQPINQLIPIHVAVK
ncbi:MAG TPA: hypothetical protein VME43_25165 [Bryobacteraceae bacterium]|nr:hypothetical protein [Bryobacteraceae bacterium]